MRSSSGEHYIALDHIRAVAIFLVFSWHFMHWATGYPVPFTFTPAPAVFPLAILDEGHTGVALFMTLSGYLFAKLLDGKQLRYRAFLWNRFLRLVPLYVAVLFVIGIQMWFQGWTPRVYLGYLASGIPNPSLLPAGGWSIAAEAHFYVLLPLLLWAGRKSKWALPACLGAAILFRVFLYLHFREIKILAYATIIGRLDQFLLGIMAFQSRHLFTHRHRIAAIGVLLFAAFYWWFDKRGGYYNLSVQSPSLKSLWIILPTIEGAIYGMLIAYYESSFSLSNTGFSRILGRIGNFSYSIYLLHFFFVSQAAAFVHTRIMDISNFYVASLWALVCFALMIPIGLISFNFIERPFLKFRRKYGVAIHTAVESQQHPGS